MCVARCSCHSHDALQQKWNRMRIWFGKQVLEPNVILCSMIYVSRWIVHHYFFLPQQWHLWKLYGQRLFLCVTFSLVFIVETSHAVQRLARHRATAALNLGGCYFRWKCELRLSSPEKRSQTPWCNVSHADRCFRYKKNSQRPCLNLRVNAASVARAPLKAGGGDDARRLQKPAGLLVLKFLRGPGENAGALLQKQNHTEISLTRGDWHFYITGSIVKLMNLKGISDDLFTASFTRITQLHFNHLDFS